MPVWTPVSTFGGYRDIINRHLDVSLHSSRHLPIHAYGYSAGVWDTNPDVWTHGGNPDMHWTHSGCADIWRHLSRCPDMPPDTWLTPEHMYTCPHLNICIPVQIS